ncbi:MULTISPECIES: hypothetical protein [unclassified Streptomyces]|uniref:hypothetical protein n=1 Tax=unclassified Streptomyces TaxID=2593676 RepID=UPI0003A504F0|nr:MULTISPECIES: hypothetical protein [unclassified Streptomyces]MYY01549.1 hypothetical protein [Streptomyces sp. SID4913]
MTDPYYDPNEPPQDAVGSPPPPGPGPSSSEPDATTTPWANIPPQPDSAPGYGPQPPPYPAIDGNLDPLPIPGAPTGVENPADERVRIGLWGAPRSGKTTYLASMAIAAMQMQRHSRSNWVIGGMNPESIEFLNDGVTQLAIQRVFPDATVGLQPLSWSFQGSEEGTGPFKKSKQTGFILEVQDVTGEAYRGDEANALRPRVLDQLARSQGLIYLYDPLLDSQRAAEGLNFLYSMLTELNARVRDAGKLHRNRLPHHVSVCITKFDDPEVFRPAVEAGYVTQSMEGNRLPRVPDEQAGRFFQWMCDDVRGASARLVRDCLAAFFHPQRISYYATSAIGFRLNPQHIFDYRNYLNVEVVNGERRICTSPVPINVLEPLIDLEKRIRSGGSKPWQR